MSKGCEGVPSGKLGVAFVCVIGAALAAVAGAIFVVLVPIKNNLFLASSLSFACGVMLYISFVDIYAGKSVGHFEDAGYTPAYAFTYATICFFCGFPISWVLDKLAEHLVYKKPASKAEPPMPAHETKGSGDATPSLSIGLTPANKVDTDEEAALQNADGKDSRLATTPHNDSENSEEHTSKKLMHLGLLAAMAMALHNMPEGLVTFVGYMDSITSGITTAAAIAVHNFPEGMVITSAVYFGTKQRMKAVLWTLVAALAEPLGGLIGLAVVCGGSLTDTVFGIMFGLVAGIMTYINLKELLPGARRFDPKDRVTTTCMAAGMMVMACSLVAIAFSQPGEEELDENAIASPPEAELA